MAHYAFIQNEKINGCGQCKNLTESVLNIEVEEDVYNNIEKYIYKDGEIVINPNYEQEQEQKEKERIAKLTCTKRVFALMLQELGITYTMLKELIATNEQAQLEWDLSVQLERGNPLIDIFGEQLGVTREQIDILFKVANGEATVGDLQKTIKTIEPEENLNNEVIE